MKNVLDYPDKPLKEQIRDFNECFSAFTVINRTFFSNKK